MLTLEFRVRELRRVTLWAGLPLIATGAGIMTGDPPLPWWVWVVVLAIGLGELAVGRTPVAFFAGGMASSIHESVSAWTSWP